MPSTASVKSHMVVTEDGGFRELTSEEVVSRLLTKSLKHTSPVYVAHVSSQQQQLTAATASRGRRAAPVPERSVESPPDMNVADPTVLRSTNNVGGLLQRVQSECEPSVTERRDPPSDWEVEASNSPLKREKPPLIPEEAEEERDVAFVPLKKENDVEIAEDEPAAQASSPTRPRAHPPNTRQPYQAVTLMTTPYTPSSQPLLSKFPFIPNMDDRHRTRSPTTVTVNTEREGKKIMSQAEMSEFVRSTIVKARQQAAANTQGKQIPRTTMVELLPTSVRTTFRTALSQQPIGKPDGPFPWSPILAHAAAAQHQLEDLEMRSVAEWTEPSQLTEPSTLMAMGEPFRQNGGHLGAYNFFVADRNELYEEVTRQRTTPKTVSAVRTVAKTTDTVSTGLGSQDKDFKSDVPRTIELECLPVEKSERCSSHKEVVGECQVKVLPTPTTDVSGAETRTLIPPAIDDSEVAKQRTKSTRGDRDERADALSEVKENTVKATSGATTENDEDLPDTVESLRHCLEPKSAASMSTKDQLTNVDPPEVEVQNDVDPPGEESNKVVEEEELLYISADILHEETDKNEDVPDVVTNKNEEEDDDDTVSAKELPSTIDIMSDQDIDNIVHISMDKAQKTAKKEVQELLHDSKRRKNKLVVKTSKGDKTMSNQEVVDLIKESMMRARETAQQEIAALVKDSLQLARESAKEEIRVIVEESMLRARESTQREMEEFVRESFQKARWSDASAVSIGSSQAASQAFTAADFTLTSHPTRQPSFGSHIPPKASGHMTHHLQALSEEEEQYNWQEAPDPSVEAPDSSFEAPDPSVESNRRKKKPDGDNSTIQDKKRATVKESIEPPESIEPSKLEANEDLQPKLDASIASKQIDERARDPDIKREKGRELEGEEECASSIMAIKSCTSPDVFAGIEDPDMTEEAWSRVGRKKDATFNKPGIREIEVFRQEGEEDEEEGIEIDPPPGSFYLERRSPDPGATGSAHDPSGLGSFEPRGCKDYSRSKEHAARRKDPSINDIGDKFKEIGVTINDNLREFEVQRQKPISESATALRKERRRLRSEANSEAEMDGSNSNRTAKQSMSSRSKRHSKPMEYLASTKPVQLKERVGKSDKARDTDKARKSKKESRHSGSDVSTKKSSHSKKSSRSARSKSPSISIAAESVVTQEFLARLAPRDIKDLATTPRAKNSVEQTAPQVDGDGKAKSHKRMQSKDSITVPENKFCLPFLNFLVAGGDESVAGSTAGSAVAARAIVSGNDGATHGGTLAALSPAAMFNKGSTWIDSLAEDMSSVLEGDSSTDIDTEGETTYDQDDSSFSQTDGEVEEEEEEEEDFTFSQDDHSYNAGWWSGQRPRPRPGPLSSWEKKVWRTSRQKKVWTRERRGGRRSSQA